MYLKEQPNLQREGCGAEQGNQVACEKMTKYILLGLINGANLSNRQ
jgi:hypothetical protein